MMILVNAMEKIPNLKIDNCKLIIRLLFPFAPHLAQELWERLGNKTLLDNERWPVWDEKLVTEDDFDLLIQVNGKLRAKTKVHKGIGEEQARALVLTNPDIKKWVEAKEIKKVIFVPDRLINFII